MAQLTPQVSSNDHIEGSLSALLVLVEYGDYQCPYCKEAFPVVKQLQEYFTDRMAYVFRNFPLSEEHEFARNAAFAAEAAGNLGKFWQMHDILFERQDEWVSLPTPDTAFSSYAIELGLERGKFEEEMALPTVEQKVENDFLSGIKSGVNGTPTFFINGDRYDGEHTFAMMKEALERKENNG